MKRIRFFAMTLTEVVALCFFTTYIAMAQQPSSYAPISGAAADDMIRTYSFYIAQATAVQEFSLKFPELAPELSRAQARFDMAFKTSVENIDSILTKETARWAALKPTILENMRNLIVSSNVTQAQARELAREVSSRAEGKIQSPFLETLLIYHPVFLRNPSEIMTQGYKRTFQSNGHPKAKGVHFQIDYPASWKAREGERPNILSKFVSENGRGFESVMLTVKELPISGGKKISDADIQDLFSDDGVKFLLGLPRDARFISSARIKLEGLPGAMVNYEWEGQRLDMVFRTRNLTFITLFNDKLIFIDCGVIATKGQTHEIETRIKRLEPLFKLIANSLMVRDRWPK